ncbi:hypothetical protein [aff. Roholtiella sp. LEGE 12411]|uniref:hypothetical protein n=1 Tax=aff. Roholtiella sp. LEGE 12411 TaxID=1828822 RepID=UPI001880C6D0|nr:hypothetical protein [aff. Roholtiella sp. LEGE 12411]MBE9035720.1 hypothetical protein [aff. Roholtiella sp. LEGE 12411]
MDAGEVKSKLNCWLWSNTLGLEPKTFYVLNEPLQIQQKVKAPATLQKCLKAIASSTSLGT